LGFFCLFIILRHSVFIALHSSSWPTRDPIPPLNSEGIILLGSDAGQPTPGRSTSHHQKKDHEWPLLGVFTMTETTCKQLVNRIINNFPKQKLFVNISKKTVNNCCLGRILIRPPEAVAKFKQKHKQLVKKPDLNSHACPFLRNRIILPGSALPLNSRRPGALLSPTTPPLLGMSK